MDWNDDFSSIADMATIRMEQVQLQKSKQSCQHIGLDGRCLSDASRIITIETKECDYTRYLCREHALMEKDKLRRYIDRRRFRGEPETVTQYFVSAQLYS